PIIHVKLKDETGEYTTVKMGLASLTRMDQYGPVEINLENHDWTTGMYRGDTGVYKPINSLGLADFDFPGIPLEQLIDFTKKAKDYKVVSKDDTEVKESGPSSPVGGLFKEESQKDDNTIPHSYPETDGYRKGSNFLINEGYSVEDVKVITFNDID